MTVARQEGRIQGAAPDVFETESIDPNDPLLGADNLILAPQGICRTDECFRGNGVGDGASILAVAARRVPHDVVNRPVLDRPRPLAKLRHNASEG